MSMHCAKQKYQRLFFCQTAHQTHVVAREKLRQRFSAVRLPLFIRRRLGQNGVPTNVKAMKSQPTKKTAKKPASQANAAKSKPADATAGGGANGAAPAAAASASASGDDPEEEWSFRPAEVQGARPPTRRDGTPGGAFLM